LKDYASASDERLEKKYSIENAVDLTKSYAFTNSVRDHFEAQTGIRPDEEVILAIAYDEDYKTYLAEMRGPSKNTPFELLLEEGLYAQQDGDRDDEIDELRSAIDSEKLHDVAQECFRRRGVLLYFDQNILLPTTDQGELGAEIVTITDNPLFASSITGIEFLSPADREAVIRAEGLTPPLNKASSYIVSSFAKASEGQAPVPAKVPPRIRTFTTLLLYPIIVTCLQKHLVQ
jgi:hypothetical protein